MRAAALKYKILPVVVTLVTVILLLMPFHALLSVWGSSLVGHYTALRLWKEALLIICLAAVSYLLLSDKKLRGQLLNRRLVWLILSYIVITIVMGVVAYERHHVSLKPLGYALIINLRFLGFFLVTWVVSLHSGWLRANWQRLVLWPALVVVLFGLLQVFVLPNDFLKHFGYNLTTIAPFETINNNSYYVRVISTLRGANPLGAYLVIPISVLVVIVLRGRRHWQPVLLLLASLITLGFSFSRSAWLGVAISVTLILALSLRSKAAQKRSLIITGIGLIVLSGLMFNLRHNTRVENVLFHTQTQSAVKTTSNQGHIKALKSGLNDLAHNPLGNGPGSAGPASVYNSHSTRISENYYIQIGQELGWLGLIIFLLINTIVGYLLWLRRADPLALSLFASLVGLSFINLLSHAWTDDTLAYIWWGLAGIAMVKAKLNIEDETNKQRAQ